MNWHCANSKHQSYKPKITVALQRIQHHEGDLVLNQFSCPCSLQRLDIPTRSGRIIQDVCIRGYIRHQNYTYCSPLDEPMILTLLHNIGVNTTTLRYVHTWYVAALIHTDTKTHPSQRPHYTISYMYIIHRTFTAPFDFRILKILFPVTFLTCATPYESLKTTPICEGLSPFLASL